MKRLATLLLATLAALPLAAEDFFDDLDRSLTWSSADAQTRARVSGTLDLEGYRFTQPAPALIDAGGGALFNPRLTTFLDVQVGAKIYLFAQTRIDRGFDPSADPLQARLDEVALRVTPFEDAHLNLQVGRFATLVGNWVQRHGSWDNPFVSAPLVYENLTGLWDALPVRSAAMLLDWSHVSPPLAAGQPANDKYLRVPVIWGPSYTTGAAVFGEWGAATYAAEVKNASLSSRPGVWDDLDRLFQQPTVSARLGWRPSPMWNVGLSASTGDYLTATSSAVLPGGYGRRDYRETVLAQDASFAWHHFQAWAEVFETRFAVPLVHDVSTVGYYLELKYRLTPRFSAAVRWNRQTFSDVLDSAGQPRPWSPNLWRLDLAPAFRFTPHTQLKFQYSLEHASAGPRTYGHSGAVQWVLRY